MSNIKKSQGGRPKLTEIQKTKRKQYILQKLEPYLKSGLSVNKALKEAKVFNSEFYKYMAKDRFFGEKIAQFRQYISILVNKILVTELFKIVEKQEVTRQSLNEEDREFLFWFALNSNNCKEEWGRRKNFNLFNPEMELQRLRTLIHGPF